MNSGSRDEMRSAKSMPPAVWPTTSTVRARSAATQVRRGCGARATPSPGPGARSSGSPSPGRGRARRAGDRVAHRGDTAGVPWQLVEEVLEAGRVGCGAGVGHHRRRARSSRGRSLRPSRLVGGAGGGAFGSLPASAKPRWRANTPARRPPRARPATAGRRAWAGDTCGGARTRRCRRRPPGWPRGGSPEPRAGAPRWGRGGRGPARRGRRRGRQSSQGATRPSPTTPAASASQAPVPDSELEQPELGRRARQVVDVEGRPIMASEPHHATAARTKVKTRTAA